jgi:hypothetical protein
LISANDVFLGRILSALSETITHFPTHLLCPFFTSWEEGTLLGVKGDERHPNLSGNNIIYITLLEPFYCHLFMILPSE